MSMAKAVGLVVGLAVVAGAAVGARHLTRPAGAKVVADAAAHQGTHSAFLRADGVIVARPGAHVVLRAEIGGLVKEVTVNRGQLVRKGDVLVKFDRNQQAAALQEAWAVAGEAQTHLKARSEDYKRSKQLVAKGALPKQELDDAARARKAASARVAAAGAAAQRLGAALEKTQVVAPIDGTVVARSVDAGETLAPGAPLLEIADLNQLRVEAEVDEFYVGQVAAGGSVEVSAEAFAEQTWSGQVEEIGDSVIPRKLRPLDPSRPGDVGIFQVWTSIPAGTPLKLGQRVRVGAALAPPPKPPETAGSDVR